MTSGQMWNHIRGPPFMHKNPQTGQVVSGIEDFRPWIQYQMLCTLRHGTWVCHQGQLYLDWSICHTTGDQWSFALLCTPIGQSTIRLPWYHAQIQVYLIYYIMGNATLGAMVKYLYHLHAQMFALLLCHRTCWNAFTSFGNKHIAGEVIAFSVNANPTHDFGAY